MGDKPTIHRGYSALRRGRCSFTGTSYFITCCLHRPLGGLTDPCTAPLIQARLVDLEQKGYWRERTSVLMPDHIHLVVTLDAQTTLPGVIRLFKGPLTPVLRKKGLRWQENFYDHRIRPDDKLSPIFLYIFLNPYQAGLAKAGEKWPWYRCSSADWEWFGGMTNEALPFPEWLL